MNFSAVILASERPTRKMPDKAFVEIDGRPLLARQIQLALAGGAGEVFIYGRHGVDYTAFGCPVLKDKLPFAGPLAGIEHALSAAAHALLLVLAVDMPSMRLDCLQHLVMTCSDATGVVPCQNNVCEPLAAFYPRQAHSLAKALLGNKQLAVRRFAEGCLNFGLVRRAKIPASAISCFPPARLEPVFGSAYSGASRADIPAFGKST